MCVDEGVGIYNKNLINLIQLHDSYLWNMWKFNF
jgi:hypothetical protein